MKPIRIDEEFIQITRVEVRKIQLPDGTWVLGPIPVEGRVNTREASQKGRAKAAPPLSGG